MSIIISSLTYELLTITHLSLQMYRFFGLLFCYWFLFYWIMIREHVLWFWLCGTEKVFLWHCAWYMVFCEFENVLFSLIAGFYIHLLIKLICCVVQIFYPYHFLFAQDNYWESYVKISWHGGRVLVPPCNTIKFALYTLRLWFYNLFYLPGEWQLLSCSNSL